MRAGVTRMSRPLFRTVLAVLRRAGVALAVTLAVFTLVGTVVLRRHAPVSAGWVEFSIGPASGDSTWVSPNALHSDGITLKGALATAYDIPSVRVIAPPWLAQTRYAIHAAVDAEARDSFRPLLLQELTNRLDLHAHVEIQPFDVFVLTAAADPRLDRAHGLETAISVHSDDAKLQASSMDDLASALQGVLGKPVINETGIIGLYNLNVGWTADRAASITAALRDRFGLRLTPGQRDMEALIVDGVERDPAMVLMAHAGRIARGAPYRLRQRIASVLTIR